MAKEAQKIANLEFDELITLSVIEKDTDLLELFTSEIDISIKLLKTLALENKLSNETKEFLVSIFNQVILTKKDLVSKYLFIADSTGKDLGSLPVTKEEPIVEPVIATPKKEKAVPRRYGKEKILKDISTQGFKATSLQNAMLALNDLKNLMVNVNSRCIKDLFTDKDNLSDEDCRDIISTVKIAKQKLKEILNKK